VAPAPLDEIRAELSKAVGRELTEEHRRGFGIKDAGFFIAVFVFEAGCSLV
jgi:hypothetical protein